jgi:hypothetical protein
MLWVIVVLLILLIAELMGISVKLWQIKEVLQEIRDKK